MAPPGQTPQVSKKESSAMWRNPDSRRTVGITGLDPLSNYQDGASSYGQPPLAGVLKMAKIVPMVEYEAPCGRCARLVSQRQNEAF